MQGNSRESLVRFHSQDRADLGHGRREGGNVEVKYNGPDGVMIDVSETGWVGTTGNM